SNNDIYPRYPSSFDFDNIIAVAATGAYGSANNLAAFSNYGIKSVDIGAPGVGILSTVPNDIYGSDYGYMDGTSMAAPLVAGAASLIWSKNPELTYLEVKDSILNGVNTSGTNLTNLVKTGGVLDVYRSFLIASYEYQTKTNISLDASSPWDWNTPVNWEFSTDKGATWTTASEAPSAYNCHKVTIKSGHNVSITDDLTLCKTTIEDGASLTVADGINLDIIEWGSGNDLTINGTMFNRGVVTADADIAGSGKIVSGSGSAFEYIKPNSQGIFDVGYFNLSLSGENSSKTCEESLTVDNNLLLGENVTLTLDGNLSVSGSSSLGGDITNTGEQTYRGTATIANALSLSTSMAKFYSNIDTSNNSFILTINGDAAFGGRINCSVIVTGQTYYIGLNANMNDATDLSIVLDSTPEPINSPSYSDANFGVTSWIGMQSHEVEGYDSMGNNTALSHSGILNPDTKSWAFYSNNGDNVPDVIDDDNSISEYEEEELVKSEATEVDYLSRIVNYHIPDSSYCIAFYKHPLFKTSTDLYLEAII
ncbi:MAG: S8 family serine peptidase, partial [Lentisphaerota bacterium]